MICSWLHFWHALAMVEATKGKSKMDVNLIEFISSAALENINDTDIFAE